MNLLLGEAFQRIRAAKQKHDELRKYIFRRWTLRPSAAGETNYRQN